MIHCLYSVYDKVAKVYGKLIPAHNDEIAIRDFSNFVKTPGSVVHSNPSDFELVCCGVFNDETGVVTGSDKPTHVAYASEYVEVPNGKNECY